MKKMIVLLTFAALISCQKENEEPVITQQTLHYDGSNQSAPVLARGISYPAVRFPSYLVQSSNFVGKNLEKIDFHLTQIPQGLKVLLFEWNTTNDSEPGNLLYEARLANLESNAWNSHALTDRVSIPSRGIWIAFEVEAGDRDLRVIGCDPGPRKPDGDIYGIFGVNNPGWSTFYNFSLQEVNINWNIRAVVAN